VGLDCLGKTREVTLQGLITVYGKSLKLTPCHPTPIKGEGESHSKREGRRQNDGKKPPSETSTRSPQKPSQTIGDHYRVTANTIPNRGGGRGGLGGAMAPLGFYNFTPLAFFFFFIKKILI
jgi:hypothetical protein